MKKILGLLLLLFLLLPATVAEAESAYTNVSADADVRSQFPTTNFGAGSHNYAFRSSSNGTIGRLFLKFPLPSIPAGSTINQAYIIFKTYTDECFGTPSSAYIAAAASDWSESSINWNNQPQPQNPSTFIYPCEANGWVAAPALDIISGMIAGSRPNYGFIVYGTESGNWQRSIYSKEYDGYTSMAYMYLMYTPPAPAAPTQPSGTTGTGNTSTTGSTSSGATNGVSTGNKAAPAKTTSSKILPPGNLTAVDISTADQSLSRLSWDKSTTSAIDGYKIFRSENGVDYQNIASADKNTLTFTDTLEAGKTYYYKLRSYKASDESADSNIAQLASKAAVQPPVVASPEKKLTLKDKILNFLKSTKGKIVSLGLIVLILAAATAGFIIWRKRKSAKIALEK